MGIDAIIISDKIIPKYKVIYILYSLSLQNTCALFVFHQFLIMGIGMQAIKIRVGANRCRVYPVFF